MTNCGVQVSLPGNRLRVARGHNAYETFRQKSVQRFDADYLSKARDHGVGRNEAVWRVLAVLSFLRNYGRIPANAVVNWDGAHVQAMSGDPEHDAAHRLPCQILINGRFPWNYLTGHDINTAFLVVTLRRQFGDVKFAPKVFNRADSIAENHCLRGALVDACTQVIRLTRPIKREAGVVKSGYGGVIELTVDQMANPSAGIDHAAVVSAYGTWITRSMAAFDRAIAHVEAHGTTSDHKDVSEDVIYILQRYKRFALDCAAPTDRRMWDFEAEFWLTAEQAEANKATGATAAPAGA
jgi:hypothetical protein